MESKIMLETFGQSLYRLTLPVEACETDKIAFANLRWLIDGNGEDFDGKDCDTFTVTRAKLHKANRAIRIALTSVWFIATKWSNKSRKRNWFLKSGLHFCKVAQRSNYGLNVEPYGKGNMDLENATDSEFTGWQSQLITGTSKQE